VTRRIAVLDFDEKTGALLPGVPYKRPEAAPCEVTTSSRRIRNARTQPVEP